MIESAEDRMQPKEGRCNAHREDGTYCRAWPMQNGRCHRHGGKVVSGLRAGPTLTGRVSKSLPRGLREKHAQMMSDEQLLSLREEIALIDVRIADVLENLQTEDGAVMWRRLKVMKSAYDRHIEGRRQAQAQETLDRIFTMIEQGADEFSKWEQVMSLVDTRRKTVESERKRMVEMNQTITSEQAMLMIHTILESLRRNVTDKDVLYAVSRDITSIFGLDARGQA